MYESPSTILKSAKAELGLTHESIAALTGLSYQTVWRCLEWEPNLNWATIRLVAACLRVPLKWLCPEGVEDLNTLKAEKAAHRETRRPLQPSLN